MTSDATARTVQEGPACAGRRKADFRHVYDQPDPRDYFCTLGALDYEIPWRARPVFAALLQALRAGSGGPSDSPLSVLDLCCSYGINAALMRCDVTWVEMLDRYADPALDALPSAELRDHDRDFFDGRRRDRTVEVAGLDVAARAVDYATSAGLLDHGWAEDLESGEPSPSLAAHLPGVDLVTTTGGVGYITERTFARVLDVPRDGSPPWVAAFVLRMFSYDAIAETLARYGLVTEQLTGVTFPQRRFASDAERDAALAEISARGLDPTDLEEAGRYHAELYVSRPEADVDRQPITELLREVEGTTPVLRAERS